MARPEKRLPENVPGDFYVDETCIHCGTCWRVAPATFASATENARVRRQPATGEERERALMALVSCPTASIGTGERHDARTAARRFPERLADDVSFCGFTSPGSFGGFSYLIRRPEGNVLVDSPRAAGPLLERIEALGGVRLLFLTHVDDVADHARLAARFGCERVMHRADADSDPGTAVVERKLDGRDPVALAPDLLAIPVPGHTRGSAALLYRDEILFTGDHLFGDEDDEGRPVPGLDASRAYCWDSWPEQVRSMERLLEHRFTWVLPGHGPWRRADSPEAMRAQLEALIERMRGE